MKKLFVIILVFLTFSTACEKEESYNKENLSKAFVEILIAKEKHSNDYSRFAIVRDSILTNYKFNEVSYQQHLNKLLTSDENWQSFYDSSQSYLVRLRDQK